MNRFAAALLGAFLIPASGQALSAYVSLGAAQNYTITATGASALGAGAGVVTLGSASNVTGNVGARASAGVGAGSTITGRLDTPLATIGPGSSINGISPGSATAFPAGLVTDVNTASANALALTPNQTLASLSGGTTLNSVGSVSIFNVTGNVFANGSFITLNGSAGDQFVINVAGTGTFLGGGTPNSAGVRLTGGLRADDVLFNFHGGIFNNQIQFTTNSAFTGNLLAPNRFVQVGDGVRLQEARLMGGGVQANLQTITPPVAIPVPQSAALAAAGLLLLGGVFARRRDRGSSPVGSGFLAAA